MRLKKFRNLAHLPSVRCVVFYQSVLIFVGFLITARALESPTTQTVPCMPGKKKAGYFVCAP